MRMRMWRDGDGDAPPPPYFDRRECEMAFQMHTE